MPQDRFLREQLPPDRSTLMRSTHHQINSHEINLPPDQLSQDQLSQDQVKHLMFCFMGQLSTGTTMITEQTTTLKGGTQH